MIVREFVCGGVFDAPEHDGDRIAHLGDEQVKVELRGPADIIDERFMIGEKYEITVRHLAREPIL